MADARLTTSSSLALGIIDKLGEAGPYDVKTEAGRTVAPFWSVPHPQVYAQCDRLLAAGQLTHVDWSSGPGLSLVVMVAGLLAARASGRLTLRGGGPGSSPRPAS
ncbi:hypothetical protein AB0N17_06095 [Streptomyces sp. NPDC051133]|uniref:hypothetical protein n=1 Tax=Streptomyces sp. NPDC051133 TaxID=3155521 RepID=UPI00341636E4